MTLIQDATVQKIAQDVAEPFIEKWHYSHRCPTGKNIFFGWFLGETLYAIADYGIGVNPFQASFLTRETGADVQSKMLVELKRLCRIEPKNDRLPLTAFISRCHKMLKQEGYCYVVSFSDPAHGHNGGIYKAANFQHLGKTQAETHCVDQNGEVRHRRYYFRYARRNNIDVATARKELGLTLVKTPPKDRWFLQIGQPAKKTTLNYLVLPMKIEVNI